MIYAFNEAGIIEMKNSFVVCAGLLVVLALPLHTFAVPPDGYSFVSPKPGATHVQPGTGILLHPTHGPATYPPASSLFVVKGEASGEHHGSVRLGGGGVTIYFKPDRPFRYGEKVVVRFEGDASQGLPGFDYSFTVKNWISPERIAEARRLLERERSEQESVTANTPGLNSLDTTEFTIKSDYDLPEEFPPYAFTTTANATPGNTFMNFGTNYPFKTMFHLVLDDSGKVIYYYRAQERTEWFAPHDDLNLISWFSFDHNEFSIMDTTWTLVKKLACVGGYAPYTGGAAPETNFHDMTLFPDTSAIVMANDYAEMDMTSYGGRSDAVVIGALFQVLDKNNVLLFQWRSLEDSTIQFTWVNHGFPGTDLSGSPIDYMHMNKVTRDFDGNYLISSRHTDAIYKISSDSAKVMWVFGGIGNQFTLTDSDARWFSGQHDVQRLPNGHIIFFDNGSKIYPDYCRAIEYDLDEEAKTATIAWEYDYGQSMTSRSRGSVQRFENGNTLIGWGEKNSGAPNATEVDSSGNIVGELQMEEGSPYPNNLMSYRAYRSSLRIRPLVPQVMIDEAAATPRILFAKFGDPDVVSYELDFWSSSTAEHIDTVVDATSLYVDWLPNGTWQVAARALYNGSPASGYSDTLGVIGSGGLGRPDERPQVPASFTCAVYPNPFNSQARITVTLAKRQFLRLQVFDLLGRTLRTVAKRKVGPGIRVFTLSMDGYSSGEYYVRAALADGSSVTKRIVLVR